MTCCYLRYSFIQNKGANLKQGEKKKKKALAPPPDPPNGRMTGRDRALPGDAVLAAPPAG